MSIPDARCSSYPRPASIDRRSAITAIAIAIVEAGAGVNICDVKTGSCRLLAFKETIGDLALSPPDGRVLAMFTNGDRVRLWDTASLEPLGDALRAPRRSPSARTDNASRSASATRRPASGTSSPREPVAHALRQGGQPPEGGAFADGATRLVTASDDRKLRIWEPTGGRLVSHHRASGLRRENCDQPRRRTRGRRRLRRMAHLAPAVDASRKRAFELQRADVSSIAFGANGARLVGAATMGQFDFVGTEVL